jgi:hypothetical protein
LERLFLLGKTGNFGTVGNSKPIEACQILMQVAPQPAQKIKTSPSGNLIDSNAKKRKLTRKVFWVAKIAIAIAPIQRKI